MSVGKVMIEILLEKGFTISEIGRLAEIDRSSISHTLHGTHNYSGKKLIGRLTALLEKTGYNEEQYKRVQDAIYHRNSAVNPSKHVEQEKTIQPVTQTKPVNIQPTCNTCPNQGKLYPIILRDRGVAPFNVCLTCFQKFTSKGMVVQILGKYN